MDEELLKLMKPITRYNMDQLELGEWIWDNLIVSKPNHGRKLGHEEIQEPIGFRQVHILENDPFLKRHSSKLFMLSDIDYGGYRWVNFEEGRFYMFKRKGEKKMSNKLRKKIKCCLCEKEVPITKDCQKLFDSYDVCPDCVRRLVGFVGGLINDSKENKEDVK